MRTALDGAKLNMRTFGYLQHVLIAMTGKGPLITSLIWTTNTEKTKIKHKTSIKQDETLKNRLFVFFEGANKR